MLGVLVEKSLTTPGGYPMTVNAIVTGSNQKSNRHPQTILDDADVENALNDLIDLGAVELIDWVGRTAKYKHLAYDWLSVGRAELAVLGELLLRGPQTLGELRARASRMERIADLAALEPVVARLVRRGLMLELTPPGRGQIVTHGLYPREELEELRERMSGAGPAVARSGTPEAGTGRPGGHPIAPSSSGSADFAALRAEVDELRRRVQTLEGKLEARGT